jgi:hypothetical protein
MRLHKIIMSTFTNTFTYNKFPTQFTYNLLHFKEILSFVAELSWPKGFRKVCLRCLDGQVRVVARSTSTAAIVREGARKEGALEVSRFAWLRHVSFWLPPH